MTIKSFSFLNPSEPEAGEKNWRVLQESSKYIDFSSSITVTNITNYGSAKAWCQTYGPMAYYYIKLTSAGGNMTSAGGAYISGMPFGPPTLSGLKSTIYTQWLDALDTNGNELAANQRAQLIFSTARPRINVPGVIATPDIYVYGWFLRDA
jgi:hypothetical protein